MASMKYFLHEFMNVWMELMYEFIRLNICGHMKSKNLYGKYRKFLFVYL
jgi:hypothetical protein